MAKSLGLGEPLPNAWQFVWAAVGADPDKWQIIWSSLVGLIFHILHTFTEAAI